MYSHHIADNRQRTFGCGPRQEKSRLIFCLTFSFLYCIYYIQYLHHNVLLHLVRRYAVADSSEAGVHFACRMKWVGDKTPTQ